MVSAFLIECPQIVGLGLKISPVFVVSIEGCYLEGVFVNVHSDKGGLLDINTFGAQHTHTVWVYLQIHF